jgi:hypothetical protein
MDAATSGDQRMLNKVPQLTIYFWIIKIMATTVGETVADVRSRTCQPFGDIAREYKAKTPSNLRCLGFGFLAERVAAVE